MAAAVAGGLPTPRVILVNPIGAPALEGPRGILTRLAVFYYWAGARLPQPVGDALLRNGVIVRVMSVSMAKTRDAELRRFIHDQHDTYFSRFADRDVLHDAFLASVSHDVREFAPRIAQPTLLVAAARDDITPIEAERHLATLFPDAETRRDPGCRAPDPLRDAGTGGRGDQAVSRAFRSRYALTFIRLPQFPVSQ